MANKIVCDYVNQYGINSLTTFFKQYANVYQFVYSTLFPKHFCRIDNDAIESRCICKTAFVNFKAQKHGFNLNIKPENVINTAASTSIKAEPEEKEEIEKIMKNWTKKLRSAIKEKKSYWRSWWKHKKNCKIKIKKQYNKYFVNNFYISCNFLKIEGKHIQLPHGLLSDDEPKNLSHFNLPPNYNRDILFEQFPYLNHVKIQS